MANTTQDKVNESGSRSDKRTLGAGPLGKSFSPAALGISVADHSGGTMPAVQAKGGLHGSDIHRIAAAGTRGAGRPLPFLDTIQRSFGPGHDLSGVRAYVGGGAADACGQMGARAYARGSGIAFAGTPDLHTAAHEAAHVAQQQGGVSLKGGVGEVGDSYERQADAVADAVVRGEAVGGLPSSAQSAIGTSGVASNAGVQSVQMAGDESYLEQLSALGPDYRPYDLQFWDNFDYKLEDRTDSSGWGVAIPHLTLLALSGPLKPPVAVRNLCLTIEKKFDIWSRNPINTHGIMFYSMVRAMNGSLSDIIQADKGSGATVKAAWATPFELQVLEGMNAG